MSQHTLETDIELGKRALYCTIIIQYDFQPEEPRVNYYRDGSGYPGCPAYVEVCEVQVTTAEIADEVLYRDLLIEIGRGSWLDYLDKLVYSLIEKDCDERGRFYDEMMSNATGEEYG